MSTRLTRWEDASELWQQLGFLSRALALRRAASWAAWALVVGLALSVAALAVWRMRGETLPPLPLLPFPALSFTLLGALAGFLRRERPERAVRLADVELDLKERLTTALELVRGGGEHPLAQLQVRDAVARFGEVNPFEVFPARIPRFAGALALALAALLPLAAFAPIPFPENQRPDDRSREVAREEAARLDQLAEQLAQAQGDPSANELRRLLAEASRALEEGQLTPEQSLAALTDLEERLYRLGDADSQGLDAALAALAASLASSPGQRDLARRLATSDLKQVSRDLRRLAEEQRTLGAAERAQLGQALQTAARGAARSNERFSRSLQAAAEAINSGGQQQESQDQAQQALTRAADQAADTANREQAQALAQSSRSNLARSLGQQSRTAPRSNSSQRGASQSPSQGERGRDEQGVGADERNDAGAGSPADRDTRQTGAGRQSEDRGDSEGPQTGGSGAGSGDAGTRDSIYDPIFSGSRPEQVPGQTEFEASEVSSDPYLSPAEENAGQVKYRDVFGQYQQRAIQNVEQSYVPLGLKDLVRQYFDELDPNQVDR